MLKKAMTDMHRVVLALLQLTEEELTVELIQLLHIAKKQVTFAP